MLVMVMCLLWANRSEQSLELSRVFDRRFSSGNTGPKSSSRLKSLGKGIAEKRLELPLSFKCLTLICL